MAGLLRLAALALHNRNTYARLLIAGAFTLALGVLCPAGVAGQERATPAIIPASVQRVLDTLTAGSKTIGARDSVAGNAVARNGTLTVQGVVGGDAIAVDGNVRVMQGGRVLGSALSYNGTVTVEGGDVQGEVRSLRLAGPVKAPVSAFERTKHALISVTGLAGIGIIIALVVLMTAQGPLEAVARAVERDVSANFWVGVLWQVLAGPLLVVLALGLVITIILIPLVPIAILAWALAYAGAITLGLFAVALVLGRAFVGRNKSVHDRSTLLTSLMLGLMVLCVAWVSAALLVSVPTLGILMRFVALALSWVALTVGLGAVVRSRGGTRREDTEPTTETAIPLWQTPTPVSGVVAARRPTPVTSSRIES